MKKIALIILLVVIGFSVTAAKRTENVIGLNLGVGTPIHGGAGAGLLINVAEWARITGEISYQTNETSKAFENFGSSMMAAIFWIMLLGQTEYDDIYEYLNPEDPNFQRKTNLTSAAGIELGWPGSDWSPFVGVSQASYTQLNSFNELLQDKGTFTLYKLGLDYQSGARYVSFGGTYSPHLPESIMYGAFFKLGFVF